MQVVVLPRKDSGPEKDVELVPLNRMSFQHRIQVLDMALKTKDMDNEHFLRKVRARLDRCTSLPSSTPFSHPLLDTRTRKGFHNALVQAALHLPQHNSCMDFHSSQHGPIAHDV
jgi:hypothetical protein